MNRKQFLVSFLLSFSFYCGIAQTKPVKRPRLVVGIVIDQMRWDYLYRYYPRFGKGGFTRLMNGGFNCENTMIPYTPAVTAAGHTCIYTGSVPAMHGIVGNEWQEKGSYMYCTRDTNEKTVGSFSNEGKMSPRNMFATTIGDELKLAANFNSRVFGVALKDRGAILPAGHTADAAYWFDDSTGNWISSSFYMKTLPSWADNFNAKKFAEKYLAEGWSLLRESNVYDQSIESDTAFQRSQTLDLTGTFPHKYTTRNGRNFNALRSTPFGNSITLEFAKELLTAENLGKGTSTDMLCISLSSTDYIGHRFGPQSREVEDTYLRLDNELEAFFKMLDQKIGKGEWTVFLTADHGALQSAKFLSSKKIPSGSLSFPSLGAELNAALYQNFKVKNLIQNYFEYQLYLNQHKLDSAGLDRIAVEDFLIKKISERPEVITAFSYRNFEKQILPKILREKLENGFFPKRSGEIQIILKSQYTDYMARGTDHGAWYPYDAHIPLLWYGWGIKVGKLHRETYMTDIAATLCAMLNIQVPSGCIGKVIPEVFK